MSSVSLEEAQAHLAELIEQLKPGEEVIITQGGLPLAKVKKAEATTKACKAGFYAKPEFWMSSDFDAPLDDFQEYSK